MSLWLEAHMTDKTYLLKDAYRWSQFSKHFSRAERGIAYSFGMTLSRALSRGTLFAYN